MRNIFNRKTGIIAGALAAAMGVAAYVGLAESKWKTDDVRAHLQQGATVPAIKSAEVRAEFADTVRYIGMGEDEFKDEAMTVLRQMTDDADAEVRYAALQGYVRVGYSYDGVSTAEKVTRMQEMMKAHPEDATLRGWVANWYGSLVEHDPAEAPVILPLLAAMLDDSDQGVRLWVAGAYSGIAKYADELAPEMLDRLLVLADDKDARVRARATGSLTFVASRGEGATKVKMDAREDEILARLLERSRDEDAAVREQAVLSLSARNFDSETQAALIFAALQERKADTSEDVRVFVAGRITDVARIHNDYVAQAFDDVEVAIKDESPRVRYMAVHGLESIMHIDPPRAFAAFRTAALQPDPHSEAILRSVVSMERLAKDNPALQPLLRESFLAIEKTVRGEYKSWLREKIGELDAKATAPAKPASPAP